MLKISGRNITKIWLPATLAVTLAFLMYLLFPSDHLASVGASAANFNAGNIMSDAVMSNKGTMTEAQIQTFLKSKNTCNDSDLSKLTSHTATTGTLKGTTNTYYYHLKNGHFICMADQDFSGESAAHIIYQAAQDYNINPQVLIVLLQKEQGLVTDTWPNYNHQYAAATGYDCPDTPSGCDGAYAGFKTQVRDAAGLFHEVLTGGWTNYPVGVNYIQYNPIKSCGGTNVNIQNLATSSLYRYTPYQPNKATLAAQTGESVNCGAYGNINFWRYFTDWFGSTTQNYHFETLAGKDSAVLKTNSSSLGDSVRTVTLGDKMYTFYYDADNHNLRYALWSSDHWSNYTLDGPGSSGKGNTSHDVGQDVTATIYNGVLQVYYYDATSGALRHAWTTPSGWHRETLDGTTGSLGHNNQNVGHNPSFLIYNGQLQIYYYNASSGNLMHAWWPGGRWHFETLDGSSGSLGGHNANIGLYSAAIVWHNQLQLYYYNQTSGNLMHAWWPGGRWHFETLDGSSGSLGGHNSDVGKSITLTKYGNDQLQIYYYNASSGNLMHAWWPGGRWHFETLDGSSGSPLGNADDVGSKIVVLPLQKDLYLYYYNKTNKSWQAAYWNGSWYDSVLGGDDAPSASGYSHPVSGDLDITGYGGSSLQIYYQNSNGELEHAWFNN